MGRGTFLPLGFESARTFDILQLGNHKLSHYKLVEIPSILNDEVILCSGFKISPCLLTAERVS